MSSPIVDALNHVFLLVLPEAVLLFAACVLFVGATFVTNRNVWAAFSLIALFISALVSALTAPGAETSLAEVYAAPIYVDALARLIRLIALVAGAILVLVSWKEVPDRHAAEYFACLLVIVAGLSLTASSNDLIALFLSLELISIPTYVLLYLPRHDNAAQEAATKYFLLSVFTSAFLLFGFSYLYGLAGTTNIPAILDALTGSHGNAGSAPAVVVMALVLIVAALGFRITAVPFHFYAPDVYQGAPTCAVSLLAVMPKVAGFVALIRLSGYVWAGRSGPGLAFSGQVPGLFWLLAVITMTLGNVLALLQSNVKRLLAYSSVAHAGYMLIGLTMAHYLAVAPAANESVSLPGGVDAILFYLVAYGAMTIGAFAVLSYLSTTQRAVENEDDLIGLGVTRPAIALLMSVFLLSLIGIPLTAGFAGKFLLFMGALASGSFWPTLLAVVGAINAAIGAWYYLRILSKMYLQPAATPLPITQNAPALTALCICAGLTLFFGFYPKPLVSATARAAAHAGPTAATAWNGRR